MYDPEKGTIKVNDINLFEFSKTSILNLIEYVSQSTFLEGLSYSDVLSLNNKIELKKFEMYINEFGLYDKLHNVLEDPNSIIRENEFSSGEFQILFAIKALMSKKSIILLDEITTNMDTNTEQIFFKLLNKNKKSKVIIFISHKSTTLNLCDRVLKLKKGVLANEDI